jgi:hypothetical protein
MIRPICRIAAILSLMSGAVAVAGPRIPSSELPGRERERFVDPPGARLMQPGGPTVSWPWDTKPTSQRNCRVHVARSSRLKTVRRRGC